MLRTTLVSAARKVVLTKAQALLNPERLQRKHMFDKTTLSLIICFSPEIAGCTFGTWPHHAQCLSGQTFSRSDTHSVSQPACSRTTDKETDKLKSQQTSPKPNQLKTNTSFSKRGRFCGEWQGRLTVRQHMDQACCAAVVCSCKPVSCLSGLH